MDYPHELVAQQRSALAIKYILVDRERLTTTDLANILGFSVSAACRMMESLAQILPIGLDDEGYWIDCRNGTVV